MWDRPAALTCDAPGGKVNGHDADMDSHMELSSPRRGRFWIGEETDVRVPGAFSCSDGPTLEVDQPLTPALRQLDSDGGPTAAFAPAEDGPEHESHVVHGVLTDSGEQVTLVGRVHCRPQVPPV